MTTTERPGSVPDLPVICPCGSVPLPDGRIARTAAASINARTRSRHRVAATRCGFGHHHVADAGRVRRAKVHRHQARRGDHRS